MLIFLNQDHGILCLRRLNRLLPHFESPLSQAISRLDGSGQSVKHMTKNLIDTLKSFNCSLVFGRTIVFLDPNNRGHLYLKVQRKDESDKVFFQEAQRLKYFYDNRVRLGIKESALNVKGIFKKNNLSYLLAGYQLSDDDRARLSLPCSKIYHSIILNKVLSKSETTDQEVISATEIYDRRIHRCTPHRRIHRCTPLATDTPCHMMLLQAPAGYHYEQYIYDLEDYDSIIKGLISYVKEFGAMWSEGVIGPDSCSVFHNKND